MSEKVVISARGALTIPSRMRREMGIKGNDELSVELTADGILLRPMVSVPIELYSEERIAEFAREEKVLGKRLAQLRKRSK